MNKNDKISLSQIGLYNPQRMSDDLVENLFVVRKKQFNFLIKQLKKEKPNGIPQHHLIIAQRGMGKTTLLKRIEVELRKKELKENFVPLIFPEEQYNLKTLSEFWLNSLDALADTLETEKQTQLVKNIDQKITELGKIKNEEDLAQEAFKFLQSITASIKRRPVLLIDNMSFIFDRLEKSDQHQLRALLMDKKAPILIGASAVVIDDVHDYGAPFYDAFQISYLRKLSFEDLKEILNNLAVLTHAENIIPTLLQQAGRLKTN
ncbi:MAG: Cdc6-like AAA superfamily ATPase [Granulosicoccus sp.]|jgi:Cdc6-like AAA superfamily ATPase